MGKVKEKSMNVAEAKKRFSELLGRVAFGGETILITRRGRAMARLAPPEEHQTHPHPADIEGWLEENDPFFEEIDRILTQRLAHRPRILSSLREPKE